MRRGGARDGQRTAANGHSTLRSSAAFSTHARGTHTPFHRILDAKKYTLPQSQATHHQAADEDRLLPDARRQAAGRVRGQVKEADLLPQQRRVRRVTDAAHEARGRDAEHPRLQEVEDERAARDAEETRHVLDRSGVHVVVARVVEGRREARQDLRDEGGGRGGGGGWGADARGAARGRGVISEAGQGIALVRGRWRAAEGFGTREAKRELSSSPKPLPRASPATDAATIVRAITITIIGLLARGEWAAVIGKFSGFLMGCGGKWPSAQTDLTAVSDRLYAGWRCR